MRVRSLLAASTASASQRLAQLLSSLVTLPLALHALGLAGFGLWGAATSLAWLSGLLTLGFGAALVTLIPRQLAAGGQGGCAAYVTAALFGGLCLAAALLGLGGAALAAGLAPQPAFLLAAVILILNIPLAIGGELWMALQKGHIAALWATVQTLLGLLGIILGALAHAGVTAMTFAIFGAMFVANAGSLAHVLIRHPFLRPHRRPQAAAMRTILHQGGGLFAVTVAASCATAFDNVLTFAWAGAAASAQMAIAMRVCITAAGMVQAVTTPLWPGFAEALAQHDHHWARRMLVRGGLGVLALSLAGCGLLVAIGQPVLRWWLHQNLSLSHALLWAMAGWITATALTNVPGVLLNAALRLRPQVLALGAAALLGFGLKYLALRAFGVPGLLWVTPVLWVAIVIPVFYALAWRESAGP